MLSDTQHAVAPSEEQIKERLRVLMAHQTTCAPNTKNVEEKMKQLSKQLEEQADLHKKAVARARWEDGVRSVHSNAMCRKAEESVELMKDDLHMTKGELNATDIMKHSWSSDKNKVGL
jgi:dihydroxyacetone kinase-like predicted kinase